MTHAPRTPPVEFAKRGARAGSPPALPEAGSLGSASRDFKVTLPLPRRAPARAFAVCVESPYSARTCDPCTLSRHFLRTSQNTPTTHPGCGSRHGCTTGTPGLEGLRDGCGACRSGCWVDCVGKCVREGVWVRRASRVEHILSLLLQAAAQQP